MSGNDQASGNASADASGATPDDLREAVALLQEEVQRLRDDVTRLDGDLDESRLLNLRAAELLDIVFQQLGRPEQPTPSVP